MPPALPFAIRTECPPGACVCERELLLNDPQADLRILKLTREEEKKLLARIERIASYSELRHIEERMQAQLNIGLRIIPSIRGVRTVRGLTIQLVDAPGLCKKTRQSIPAALRRCFEAHPDIVYAILDQHDLFGAANGVPAPYTATD